MANSTAPVADSDFSSPIDPRITLLAIKADGHAASLGDTLNALIALEKFVSIERASDDEETSQMRTSLGRLMRALHEDMQRRIGQMADATAALRRVVERKELH